MRGEPQHAKKLARFKLAKHSNTTSNKTASTSVVGLIEAMSAPENSRIASRRQSDFRLDDHQTISKPLSY
jgi:hypothetical protein